MRVAFDGGSGTGFTGCLPVYFICLFLPLCAVKIQRLWQSHQNIIQQYPTSLISS